MRTDTGSTVVLSDDRSAASLAGWLAPLGRPLAWYASVDDLLKDRPLASVAVLVLHCQPLPKGIVLTHLGRMNLEYPGMQVVAILGSPPPLPMAEYLTACGVDLLWTDSKDGNLDRLPAVVARMHERTPWIAAPVM